jgi:hypothetical protein
MTGSKMKYFLYLLPVFAYGKLNHTINFTIHNQTEEVLNFDIKSFHTGKRHSCPKNTTCHFQWQQNTPFKVSLKNIRCGKHKCYLGKNPFYYHTLHSAHPQKNSKLTTTYTLTGHTNIKLDE